MDLRLLAKQITKAIKESSKDQSSVKGQQGYPIAWHFMMEEDLLGFVLLDDGSMTGLEPNVAVCLVVESADDYEREELLDILGANFALTDAAITVLPSPLEISDSLIIIFQKRPPEAFRAGDFPDIVSHLVKQRDIMFSVADEDEYEDDDDEDEEDEDDEDDEEDEYDEEEDEEDEDDEDDEEDDDEGDPFSAIESLFMDEDEDEDEDLPKRGKGRKGKKRS